jgi:hypothetical protein
MSLTESLADFNEMRDLIENLCQELYNDLNDGKPSHALRYYFLRETLEYVKANPNEDHLVQSMMEFYLTNAILTESVQVTVEKITLPEE